MAKICYFLSIIKDWLKPFKCSETIGKFEGRWYRWYMTLVGWTTDYRGWPTDYGRWPRYVGRWPKFVVSFKLTRTVWIHLNVLKWFWIIMGRWKFWSSSVMPVLHAVCAQCTKVQMWKNKEKMVFKILRHGWLYFWNFVHNIEYSNCSFFHPCCQRLLFTDCCSPLWTKKHYWYFGLTLPKHFYYYRIIFMCPCWTTTSHWLMINIKTIVTTWFLVWLVGTIS